MAVWGWVEVEGGGWWGVGSLRIKIRIKITIKRKRGGLTFGVIQV